MHRHRLTVKNSDSSSGRKKIRLEYCSSSAQQRGPREAWKFTLPQPRSHQVCGVCRCTHTHAMRMQSHFGVELTIGERGNTSATGSSVVAPVQMHHSDGNNNIENAHSHNKSPSSSSCVYLFAKQNELFAKNIWHFPKCITHKTVACVVLAVLGVCVRCLFRLPSLLFVHLFWMHLRPLKVHRTQWLAKWLFLPMARRIPSVGM